MSRNPMTKLISLLLGILLLSIFIYSCSDESTVSDDHYIQDENIPIGRRVTNINISEIPYEEDIESPKILNELQSWDFELLNDKVEDYVIDKNSTFIVPELNLNSVLKEVNHDGVVYSIRLDEEIPFSLYNLIYFFDHSGELISEYVVCYKMDYRFGLKYYMSHKPWSEYEGVIQYFEVDQILDQNVDGKNFNFDVCKNYILPCCESGTGGSNSGPIFSPSDNGTSNSDGEDGGDGCFEYFFCVPCPNPNPQGARCDGICHPDYCVCNPRSRWASARFCRSSGFMDGEDCCPIIPSSTPVVLDPAATPDASTIGNEGGPQSIDITCQGAAFNYAQDNFLESPSGYVEMVMEAAQCGDCGNCPGHNATLQQKIDYEDCVSTTIIDNSPCRSQLMTFVNENGLELDVSEQLMLVGPDGVCGESSGGNPSFNEDMARDLLCRNAISDFETTYGIELTEEEETDIRTAIEGICGDQEAVNNEALGLYLDLDEDHFEELDPDLTIDCASFHFEEINDHNIIVAGVANVHVDFYYRASNRSGYFTMFSEIWFEVPRLRSNGSIVPIGEAKRMCAQAVVDAEEEIEDIFKNVQPFQGAVRAKFIEILSANVRQWGVAGGGRATLQNNHGVDLQPAVYVSIGPGWCN